MRSLMLAAVLGLGTLGLLLVPSPAQAQRFFFSPSFGGYYQTYSMPAYSYGYRSYYTPYSYFNPGTYSYYSPGARYSYYPASYPSSYSGYSPSYSTYYSGYGPNYPASYSGYSSSSSSYYSGYSGSGYSSYYGGGYYAPSCR